MACVVSAVKLELIGHVEWQAGVLLGALLAVNTLILDSLFDPDEALGIFDERAAAREKMLKFMTNPTNAPQAPEAPAEIVPARKGLRISWTWAFPILAIAVTAWLFWENERVKGPQIQIAFAEAPGIEAGTPVYFEGMQVGVVLKKNPIAGWRRRGAAGISSRARRSRDGEQSFLAGACHSHNCRARPTPTQHGGNCLPDLWRDRFF